jgi:hypothetical protein
MSAPNQCWDAGLYDDKHAFVWQYGALLVKLLAPKPGEENKGGKQRAPCSKWIIRNLRTANAAVRERLY